MKKIFLPIGAIALLVYIGLNVFHSAAVRPVEIPPEALMDNLGGVEYIYRTGEDYQQGTEFCVETTDFFGKKKPICVLKNDKTIMKGTDIVVKMGVDRDKNALILLKIIDTEIYGGAKLPAGIQQRQSGKKINIGNPFFQISQQNKKYTLTLIAKKDYENHR